MADYSRSDVFAGLAPPNKIKHLYKTTDSTHDATEALPGRSYHFAKAVMTRLSMMYTIPSNLNSKYQNCEHARV